jgi:Flp pilus assembly protein TadG
MMRRPLTARFFADRKGAAAVEFALVAGAFFTTIIGICSVGIMAFNTVALDWAVKLASRQAEINSAATQSDLTATINNYLSSVGLSTAAVTYNVTTTSGVNTVNIAATYRQDYSIPFIPTIHMTYSSSAAVPQPS